MSLNSKSQVNPCGNAPNASIFPTWRVSYKLHHKMATGTIFKGWKSGFPNDAMDFLTHTLLDSWVVKHEEDKPL